MSAEKIVRIKDEKWLEALSRIPLPNHASKKIATQRETKDGELTWN